MFNSSKKQARADTETTSLIASGTQIRGDVQFSGRLHVDGKIEGSIRADDAAAVLTLSSHAQVVG
ncbi:MAG TPA: polymer-forming cytoskeletal protein, partial [Rudaea sp.]|nr:polymer-forming cytoskeletal protein [Rudaea sp.]